MTMAHRLLCTSLLSCPLPVHFSQVARTAQANLNLSRNTKGWTQEVARESKCNTLEAQRLREDTEQRRERLMKHSLQMSEKVIASL